MLYDNAYEYIKKRRETNLKRECDEFVFMLDNNVFVTGLSPKDKVFFLGENKTSFEEWKVAKITINAAYHISFECYKINEKTGLTEKRTLKEEELGTTAFATKDAAQKAISAAKAEYDKKLGDSGMNPPRRVVKVTRRKL